MVTLTSPDCTSEEQTDAVASEIAQLRSEIAMRKARLLASAARAKLRSLSQTHAKAKNAQDGRKVVKQPTMI